MPRDEAGAPPWRCEDDAAVRPQERASERFVNLLQRFRGRLRGVVRLRLDDRISARVDASDVVQEAYLQASQHEEQLSQLSDHSMFNFLCKMALGRALDSYRRHVRAKRRSVLTEVSCEQPSADHSDFQLAELLAADASSPSKTVSRREQLQRVWKALGELSPTDRELLVLRHLRQLNVREIAETLQTTRTVVTTRHLRALRRLRRILKADLQASS